MEYWRQTRGFWKAYTELREQLDEEQKVDTSRVEADEISRAQWRRNFQNRQENKTASWDMLTKIYSRALVSNEVKDKYRGVTGRPIPPVHIEDMATQAYYSIRATEDPITREPDLMELQARQDAFLASISPELQEYVIAEITRPRIYEDLIETEWREDRRRLRAWSGIRYELLRLHPEWQQLIQDYERARSADPWTARKIRQSEQYRNYTRAMTAARQQLRLQDAELEALLIIWGISGVSRPINPQTDSYIASRLSKNSPLARAWGLE